MCGDEPQKTFNDNIRNSILIVEDINSVKTDYAHLVFLSACCTVEVASTILINEGVYLTSGF